LCEKGVREERERIEEARGEKKGKRMGRERK